MDSFLLLSDDMKETLSNTTIQLSTQTSTSKFVYQAKDMSIPGKKGLGLVNVPSICETNFASGVHSIYADRHTKTAYVALGLFRSLPGKTGRISL